MTAEMIQARGNIMQRPGGVSNRIKFAKSIRFCCFISKWEEWVAGSGQADFTARKRKRSCPHVKATFQATTNYELLYPFIYFDHHAAQAKRWGIWMALQAMPLWGQGNRNSHRLVMPPDTVSMEKRELSILHHPLTNSLQRNLKKKSLLLLGHYKRSQFLVCH